MVNKMITIKLTPEEAKEVWLEVEGWLGAITGDDDMSPAAQAALNKLLDQTSAQALKSAGYQVEGE